jgi:hypothetical protein
MVFTKSVIHRFPRLVPMATALGFFAMKRSNEVSAVVNQMHLKHLVDIQATTLGVIASRLLEDSMR